jgi:hypothetical protein
MSYPGREEQLLHLDFWCSTRVTGRLLEWPGCKSWKIFSEICSQ